MFKNPIADAVKATKLAPRTVGRHLERLTAVGILERRAVFGGCRYRRQPGDPDMRAAAYMRRLEAVRETFAKRGIGARMAALFARRTGPVRTTIADGKPPDEAAATLVYELARIGRAMNVARQDYSERVLADLHDAWRYQDMHLRKAQAWP